MAAIALRARFLNSFPLSPDEGIHLIWLRLLSAGYQPYSEVYITYPPLYPLAIQTIWNIWPTEAAQRWFSVAYTLFGAVGIALLTRKFAGTLAGVVAAALTLFSPLLIEPSRAVLGEFPSVAWSVWAVWLAWLYRDAPQWRHIFLILSALCLSASLLTKLLSPFVVILVVLILASRWYKFRFQNGKLQLIKNEVQFEYSAPQSSLLKLLFTDLVLWGLMLLLPAIILFSVYDVTPLFRQVVDQRLKARLAYTADEAFWPPRYVRGGMFVREGTVLVVLGLTGLGLACVRRQKGWWIMLSWLALALAMLAVHNPIRYKHFLILIPPLAILGATTVSYWMQNVGTWVASGRNSKTVTAGTRRKLQTIALGGLVLLIGLFWWQIPATFKLWQTKAAVPQPPPDEVEALAFIESVTAPNDCLISDDMQLLYWSGRMAPPELAEVSSNRLISGALTLEELITVTDQYDCQLVAAVSNRIPKYLPDYMDWVKSKFLGRFHYGEDDLFFAKIDTNPNPDMPLWANFDDQIVFHGYSLPHALVSPGEQIPLTLIWQAQTAPEIDYAIFVQLRNSANITLASADHQPYQGLVPTSIWPKGAVIQEMTWLVLPPDIPPGEYKLYVGLYQPTTLERLPLRNDTSGENALILGPVGVQ